MRLQQLRATWPWHTVEPLDAYFGLRLEREASSERFLLVLPHCDSYARHQEHNLDF